MLSYTPVNQIKCLKKHRPQLTQESHSIVKTNKKQNLSILPVLFLQVFSFRPFSRQGNTGTKIFELSEH